MKDIPSHYHSIAHSTSAWNQFVDAVKAAATNTATKRLRELHSEQRREVHATGRPHSQKGS